MDRVRWALTSARRAAATSLSGSRPDVPAGYPQDTLTGVSCASTTACTAVGATYYGHQGCPSKRTGVAGVGNIRAGHGSEASIRPVVS
jgi:hypothetical protein